MTRLTKRQREIREKYTGRMTWGRGKHDARITVGHQSFTMGAMSITKRRAEWLRDRLAIALEKIIDREAKP